MAPLRSISVIAAALAVLLALAGCGGEDPNGLEPADAAAIEAKLAQVDERAAEGRCTGDNSALSSLTSLSDFVDSSSLDYVGEETRGDLEELLTRLGEQIQSQCEQASDLTTTTTTDTTTTDTTETDTTTEDESTHTRERTEDDERDRTQPRPPAGGGPGGNQGGGNQGGGGDQGGGNQGGGPPAPPASPPDGSGGIGPGVITPVLRSEPGADAARAHGSAQADPETGR